MVVDHDTGRLVWARSRPRPRDGREVPGSARPRALPADRACLLRHGRVDRPAGRRALPQRDPLRGPVSRGQGSRPTRWTRSAARSGTRPARPASTQLAKELKGARFALWKNAGNLTERQQLKLARIQQTQPAPLPRLPALPATPRDLPRPGRPRPHAARGVAEVGPTLRLEPFVKLARTITEQRARSRPRSSTDSQTRASSRSTPRSG